jgi:bacteriocin-like protein
MEKIMSKSNDTSKHRTLDLGGAATFTVRELRDDELQEVSGGLKVTMEDILVTSVSRSDVTAWRRS